MCLNSNLKIQACFTIRAYIKGRINLNISGSQKYNELCRTSAVSKTLVFRWQKKFQDGLANFQDDSSPGQPKTVATNANIAAVTCLIKQDTRGRLDLAFLFTPSTPNRQNRYQVHRNICAGVRRSTPSSEVVQTEQSRDLFQKRWRIIACMRGNILYRLIYSGVL